MVLFKDEEIHLFLGLFYFFSYSNIGGNKMRNEFKKQIVASFLQDAYPSYEALNMDDMRDMIKECKLRNSFRGTKTLDGFTYVEFYVWINDEIIILTFEYPNNECDLKKVAKALSSLLCFSHDENYYDDDIYRKRWINRNVFVGYNEIYDVFVVKNNGYLSDA